MNTPYDYHTAMERMRSAQRGPAFASVPGKYNRIFLDPVIWTPGRLIPGKYPVDIWYDIRRSERFEIPYWTFNSHYWPELSARRVKGEFVVCGRGLNDFAPHDQCPACTSVPDHDGVSRRFAYNFLGLGMYHEEKLPHSNPEKARQGKTMINWRLCQQTPTNRNCPYCNKGLPASLGYYGHWEIGYNDQKILDTLGAQLEGHCNCGGQIVIYRAACGRCHNIVVDVETSGYSDADFAKILAGGGVCPHCNQTNNTFVPVRRCTTCNKPRPLTIFDLDLQFRQPLKENGKRGSIEVGVLMGPGNAMRIGDINTQYLTALAERNIKLEPHDLPAIHAAYPPPKMQRAIRKHFGINVGPMDDDNAVPRTGLPLATGPQAPPAPAPLPPIFNQVNQARLPEPQPAAPPANPVFTSIGLPPPGVAAPAPMPAPMPAMPAPTPSHAPTVAEPDIDDDDGMPPDLD